MNNENNKYIGTIIKGDKSILKANKKVIFKANNKIYIKKIKQKSKVRIKGYVIFENVNIICDDLNKNYVLIDSYNHPYHNKLFLIINTSGIFIGLFIIFFLKWQDLEASIVLPMLVIIGLFGILVGSTLYTVLEQCKKLYKNYTETVEGEIINYARTEHRKHGHSSADISHCNYNVMYKYKLPNGNIIHSVVTSHGAEILYKRYPLNKKVLIKYNPLKCCESCLLDEYNSTYGGEKFVKDSATLLMTIGKVTNITTKCIDEEVEDYLKDYSLIDYIECDYTVGDIRYITNSMFGVPHNRFKLGEELIIFYEYDEPQNFFCDINRKYSNLDTIDF